MIISRIKRWFEPVPPPALPATSVPDWPKPERIAVIYPPFAKHPRVCAKCGSMEPHRPEYHQHSEQHFGDYFGGGVIYEEPGRITWRCVDCGCKTTTLAKDAE